MAHIIRIRYKEETFAVDVDDLDGLEVGLYGRWLDQLGRFGTPYACLLIARRRAGEDLSEEQFLKETKFGDWDLVADDGGDQEADADPQLVGSSADPPGPQQLRRSAASRRRAS